ncbi:unnamed protein product [marine sediment metagenome]|uniref:Uncharacterized protein n=1 Tax=marine sediment metagenome TaxID=412755 RepID=X0ZC68_9ZZZZ
MESDIETLEEKIKADASEKATALARMQSKLFLERIFDPYMHGVCKVWGVRPEVGLRLLIEEKTTFGTIAKNNPEALAELISQPEIQVIVAIASPLRDVSDEWIQEKMDILFDVMVDIRPELARVIVETPGGSEWFSNSLKGLRNVLFGKPTLYRETP